MDTITTTTTSTIMQQITIMARNITILPMQNITTGPRKRGRDEQTSMEGATASMARNIIILIMQNITMRPRKGGRDGQRNREGAAAPMCPWWTSLRPWTTLRRGCAVSSRI